MVHIYKYTLKILIIFIPTGYWTDNSCVSGKTSVTMIPWYKHRKTIHRKLPESCYILSIKYIIISANLAADIATVIFMIGL